MNTDSKAGVIIYDTSIGLEIIEYCKPSMDIIHTSLEDSREDAYKFLQQRIEPTQVIVAVQNNSMRKSIVDDIVGLENGAISFPNILLTQDFFIEHSKMGTGNIVLMNSLVGVNVSLGDFNIIDIGVRVMPFAKVGSFNMISEDIPRHTIIGDWT